MKKKQDSKKKFTQIVKKNEEQVQLNKINRKQSRTKARNSQQLIANTANQ
jgi:hypothetical protein